MNPTSQTSKTLMTLGTTTFSDIWMAPGSFLPLFKSTMVPVTLSTSSPSSNSRARTSRSSSSTANSSALRSSSTAQAYGSYGGLRRPERFKFEASPHQYPALQKVVRKRDPKAVEEEAGKGWRLRMSDSEKHRWATGDPLYPAGLPTLIRWYGVGL